MEGLWRTIIERAIIAVLTGVAGWTIYVDRRVASIDQWKNETHPAEVREILAEARAELREAGFNARFERVQISVTVEANEMHIDELRADIADLEDRVRDLER